MPVVLSLATMLPGRDDMPGSLRIPQRAAPSETWSLIRLMQSHVAHLEFTSALERVADEQQRGLEDALPLRIIIDIFILLRF
jgi:hypothetical protein